MCVQEAIERYRSIHPGFDGSREMKFVLDLLAAFDDEDSDKFADIVSGSISHSSSHKLLYMRINSLINCLTWNMQK